MARIIAKSTNLIIKETRYPLSGQLEIDLSFERGMLSIMCEPCTLFITPKQARRLADELHRLADRAEAK